MQRRMKVRLTDAERENIAPLADKPVDFSQYDKSVFRAKALGTLAYDGHEIPL
jgi:hypothetical protein